MIKCILVCDARKKYYHLNFLKVWKVLNKILYEPFPSKGYCWLTRHSLTTHIQQHYSVIGTYMSFMTFDLTACHDMDQWPEPVPGETVNLPIFGSVLQVSK